MSEYIFRRWRLCHGSLRQKRFVFGSYTGRQQPAPGCPISMAGRSSARLLWAGRLLAPDAPPTVSAQLGDDGGGIFSAINGRKRNNASGHQGFCHGSAVLSAGRYADECDATRKRLSGLSAAYALGSALCILATTGYLRTTSTACSVWTAANGAAVCSSWSIG